MYLDVSRTNQGPCRISFALRLEKGARPEFEVREEYCRWALTPGPKVDVSADGWLCARGRRLVQVPFDAWFKVELEFELGAGRREHVYTVSVTLPGESAPRVFTGNPMHKGFRELRWIGFQSLANGGARYWIDDFSL